MSRAQRSAVGGSAAPRLVPFLAALFAASASLCLPSLAEVRDGRLFDPGVDRAEPADSAPAELARLAPWLGDWEVTQEIHRGEEVLTAEGRARLTWMNRGHAAMERTRIPDFDGEGNAMSTLAFLGVDPQGTWTVAEGSSWTEAISLYSGGWTGEEGEVLVVHEAMRPGGGPLLLLLRRTYRGLGPDRFEMVSEVSSDLGESWGPNARREYRRHVPEEGEEDFFPVREDVGLPAPERAPEAAEFDFLLGEFDASHWLATPNGPVRRSSDATAVFALDGKAILEFDGYSIPGLEDGATSILRIYNRSMRRWENLFLPNRSHRPLYFGGVREDDRIVLHLFDAQTTARSVHQWIFFDVREDSYRWKGQSSPDRGESYQLGWAIDFVRKGVSLPESEVTPIRTRSADGTVLVGDHYRAALPGATTVVLYHQAGGDARGEYADVARWLQSEGFEVFAWDVRGGGDRFGKPNRTVRSLAEPWGGTYCDAYPDLEAALAESWIRGSGGPLFAVGSSYSAALVVRLAAEHGNRLAGVAAFSPASSRMDACAVEEWLPRVDGTPLLVARPASELEIDSVASQRELFEEAGTGVFVAEGAHGASMLHPERSEGAEEVRVRLEQFLADPAGSDSGGD